MLDGQAQQGAISSSERPQDSLGDAKVILQILAHKDSARAGQCDLIGDAIAAPNTLQTWTSR